MSKDKTPAKSADITTTTKPTPVAPNFTHTALGTYKNKSTGMWYVVEIPFNPTTLQTGEVKRVSCEDFDRATCQERFKIQAANTIEAFIPS